MTNVDYYDIQKEVDKQSAMVRDFVSHNPIEISILRLFGIFDLDRMQRRARILRNINMHF